MYPNLLFGDMSRKPFNISEKGVHRPAFSMVDRIDYVDPTLGTSTFLGLGWILTANIILGLKKKIANKRIAGSKQGKQWTKQGQWETIQGKFFSSSWLVFDFPCFVLACHLLWPCCSVPDVLFPPRPLVLSLLVPVKSLLFPFCHWPEGHIWYIACQDKNPGNSDNCPLNQLPVSVAVVSWGS